MIPFRLEELAELLDAELLLPAGIAPDAVVAGSVETDSRLVQPGSIFVALPGEVTDGHLFAPAAVEAGAAAVICRGRLDLEVPQLVVADGLDALGSLAREVVARVRTGGALEVVGITGSNGKTTTKNMLREILAAEAPTVAPRDSFNNQVGAPISMLRIDDDTRYLVVEMGASGPGRIARLVSIARPDIGVVLKVGLAHAGGFGGIDATEQAKAEMVVDLPASAVAILNADDERVARMAGRTAARVVTFGLSRGAEVRAEAVEATAAGTSFTLVVDDVRRAVQLQILGEHHVMNALAALAVARELGVDLDRAVGALERLERAERWRMEVTQRADGVTIVNDAYNASPDSVAAALKTLAQIARADDRRTVAVLGEMAELGELAQEEHDRIGRLAVRLDIRQLVVVGERARHIHAAAGLEGSWDGESVFVDDADAAYDVLRETLRPGDIVLVKSSNSAGLRHLGDRIAADGATS
ncbi:UDP-N-acetylmuramoyl-tripeptide--D-alanyl-D-alanine ligase [Homoserinibacter sp. GY 40078]|uniref:UDP-N-acetylmuramoyl-tripeptide--D-alanyl-D- alanine ligase n=1 Tax=Homoserinibacter sp. GY 40078 TaxID=2603275 RepID=UPI0011C95B63|nr:UDP-N-acetylmuramoyl-tripeptide--D-alanyl-D-alanine ligase [Homoserinibacter sp. GY 40078]TXK17691.1 UDP-N-acetylmuramoyl-tripeptide--D-alanyl-D-alanine ligase [Homoserinibacter sp. GY 40078]